MFDEIQYKCDVYDIEICFFRIQKIVQRKSKFF